MKTVAVSAAILAMMTGAMPAAAQVNYREYNQQRRIYNGDRSGRLTAAESYRLQNQQSRIDSYEARARASGGHLGPYERYRLNRMQNRASANIYRQKHDAQGHRPW